MGKIFLNTSKSKYIILIINPIDPYTIGISENLSKRQCFKINYLIVD